MGEFSMEDLISNEPYRGDGDRRRLRERLPPDTFRTQHRSGKGIAGLTTKDEDSVEHLFVTTTHDILFFTTRGRVFQLKAFDIPQGSPHVQGQAVVNFLQLRPGEKIATILPMDTMEGTKHLVMVTDRGTIKKTELGEFDNVRRSGLIAINLADGDNLRWVKPSSGADEIVLVTERGQSIRFEETDVRAMGRIAAGVRGIDLRMGTAWSVWTSSSRRWPKGRLGFSLSRRTASANGPISKNTRSRIAGGSGIRTMHVGEDRRGGGRHVSSIDSTCDLILISEKGIVIRTPFASVPSLSAATRASTSCASGKRATGFRASLSCRRGIRRRTWWKSWRPWRRKSLRRRRGKK